MPSKILASIGLIGTVMSVSAFAEPAVQPGDTLESLSKAKVMTTVNGQPGSLQDLVSSGQIKLMNPAMESQGMPGSPNNMNATDASMNQNPLAPQANLSNQQVASAQNSSAPQMNSSAEAPVNGMNSQTLPSPNMPAQPMPDSMTQQPEQTMPEMPAHSSMK